MLEFERRSVIVTGATGNLGNAVVRAYLLSGAHVAAPVRDPAKGSALRAAVADLANGEDDRLLVIDADLADRASMDAFVEQILRTWGRLDVLANLAGGFSTGPADDLDRIRALWDQNARMRSDRKSTRLNSSHQIISYAVFCLKKKNKHRRWSLTRAFASIRTASAICI